jgi:hypothetical protein
VIEEGRHPTLRVVAVGTRGPAFFRDELPSVRVDVAAFAALRGALELDFSAPWKPLVARSALHDAMRSQQRKVRFAVIKAADLYPGRGGVASYTSKRRAVAAQSLHAVAKLPAMRVYVACATSLVRKPEWQDIVGAMREACLVAFVARHGSVRAGQHELGLLMLRDGEERAMKVAHRMARLAAIVVRRAGELAVVRIPMTVRAVREFHFVDRVAARGKMALRAFHTRVSAFQRILGTRMFLHAEQGWLPTVHCMTLGAFTFSCTLDELPLMDVYVTVPAVGEGQRFLKIAADVTRGAADRGVFAEQRISCFCVIKTEARKQFLPTCRSVTGLATLWRERPFVRIYVTVNAGAEFHVSESGWSARFIRLVALFAGHLDVHSRQRIARFRVVELLRRFPVVDVVTALAIVSQLALVRVRVAGKAVLRQTEESFCQISVLNQWAQRRREVFGSVTLLACQAHVLAFEPVPRPLVVELALWWIPVQQREICAVMFQVASDAIPSVGIRHAQAAVITMARRQILRHFLVAVQTLERWSFCSELVATRALRRPR